MKAEDLPFADGEFDARDARSRCSSTCPTPSTRSPRWRAWRARALLVSVPREPLWRGLNMARGAYMRDLGNTPGHVNHWSKRALRGAARAPRRGRRGALAVPVDDAARPGLSAAGDPDERSPRRARLRPRRPHPLGRHRDHRASSRSRTSRSPSHVLDEVDYKGISLLWSVLFVIVSVIYRPIEQLLSRTIADRRARGLRADHPLRTPLLDPGRLRAALFLVVALALRGPIAGRAVRRLGAAVLGAGRRACSPTRRATSPAAGWPGTSGSASTAGSCSWRRARAACSRWRVAVGIAARADGGRAGHGGGAVRLAGRRAAGVRAPAPRRRRRRAATRAAGRRRSALRPRRALRRRRAGDHARRADAAQRRGADRRRDRDGRRGGRLRVQRAADRARAAAALPGDPGLAAPPPRRAGGDRGAPTSSTARSASRSLAIAGFAGAVALGLARVGPWAMGVLFDGNFDYGRWGLALVGDRHGLPPDRGHAQPGRAGPRPRAAAAAACVARRRRAVHGLAGRVRRSTTSCSPSRWATRSAPPRSRRRCW